MMIFHISSGRKGLRGQIPVIIMEVEVDIESRQGVRKVNPATQTLLSLGILHYMMFHLLESIVGVVLGEPIHGHVLKNKADMAVHSV